MISVSTFFFLDVDELVDLCKFYLENRVASPEDTNNDKLRLLRSLSALLPLKQSCLFSFIPIPFCRTKKHSRFFSFVPVPFFAPRNNLVFFFNANSLLEHQKRDLVLGQTTDYECFFSSAFLRLSAEV